LCIGHSPPFEQHSLRASGVANQPEHTAASPARSPAARRTADRRLIKIGTALRMLKAEPTCQTGILPETCSAGGRRIHRSPRARRYQALLPAERREKPDPCVQPDIEKTGVGTRGLSKTFGPPRSRTRKPGPGRSPTGGPSPPSSNLRAATRLFERVRDDGPAHADYIDHWRA